MPGRLPVADPHPPRARARRCRPTRSCAELAAPRHDDGAVPLGAAPARAAGRPDRGRLRARRRRAPSSTGRPGRTRSSSAARWPSSASGSARRGSPPRRSCSSARRSAPAPPAGRSHVYDPGYGHRYRPLGRPDRYRTKERRDALSPARGAPARPGVAPRRPRPRIAVLGVAGGRVPPGTEALLAGAAVVAGGRAALAALAPPGARGVVLGAGVEAAAERARVRGRAGRACSPRATRASSASSAPWAQRSGPSGSTSIPRRPRSRSRSRGSACRGTTRSSCPPTAATRGPRVHAALRHPKVAMLTEPRAPAAAIVAALAGSGRSVTVAEALGTPRERLRTRRRRRAGRAGVRRAQRRGRARPGRRRPRARDAGPVGAARGRVRPPRGHDHEGRGPRGRARRARPRDRRPRVGRRLRQRLGGDRVRAARRRRRSASTPTPTPIALPPQRGRARRAGAHGRRARRRRRSPRCPIPTPRSSAAAARRSAPILEPRRRARAAPSSSPSRSWSGSRRPWSGWPPTGSRSRPRRVQASRLRPIAGGHRLAAENPVT